MISPNFEKNPPLILVVDDEKTVRLVLRRAMEKEGYRVAEAEDGQHCLELCQEIKPDLVLLDAMMPQMDGFTCCAQLLTLLGDQRPAILMITTLSDKASVDRAFDMGADEYISKPIHWPVLFQRVRRLLQTRWAMTELLQRKKELTATNVILHTEVSERQQAELALRSSLAKNRALLNAIPDLILCISKDGTYQDYKAPKDFEMLSRGSDLIGKSEYEVLPVEVAKLRMHYIERALATNEPQTFEYQLLINGNIRDEEARVVASGNSEVLVIVRDITERKCTETRIQTLNAELEQRVLERTLALQRSNEELANEIAERKQAEERLKLSLREKEVLLKEIHHRVKNNMQVICSLLNLQAGYIEDPQVLKVLQNSQNRVASMALVHEQLYQSKDLAKIKFGEYIQNLAVNLFGSYNISSDKITLEINADNIFLDLNVAVPCSLIINELISNSLKYAFPISKSGEIRIDVYTDNNNYFNLIVSDDGIGFPKNVDFKNTDSLGLQIVNALIEQISGTIEMEGAMGTKFKIKFLDDFD